MTGKGLGMRKTRWMELATRTKRNCTFLTGIILLAGCYETSVTNPAAAHSPEASDPEAAGDERRARDTTSGTGAVDAGASVPAPPAHSPGRGPRGADGGLDVGDPANWEAVSAAEALCYGLTEPACVGCQRLGDTFYLRPLWAPPPPPDARVTLVTREECLTPDRQDWRPLSEGEAECLGLSEPACAGCHQRDGVTYLWPGDVPDPPPGGSDLEEGLLERCLES